MLLCVTLIVEREQYQFFGKIVTHFPRSHLLTSRSQMKIFIYSTYTFLLQPRNPFC